MRANFAKVAPLSLSDRKEFTLLAARLSVAKVQLLLLLSINLRGNVNQDLNWTESDLFCEVVLRPLVFFARFI